VSKAKIFWLYVSFRLQYVDEMSGDSDKLIPLLKKQAKESGIKWDDTLPDKHYTWIIEHLK
jgi:hypothetical protein